MLLSLRSPSLTAHTPKRAALASKPPAARMLVVRQSGSGPHPTLKDVEVLGAKVKEAIQEAEETCAGGKKEQCAAAWDNVEELSAAAAHKKVAFEQDKVASDPLEQFCEESPDADECRVYED